MTRILAFGDTQIGVPTVTLEEQRKVLDQIIDLAVAREVDLVIHGGDVFEGPVVTPEHLRMFIDATAPLRHIKVPLVVLRGNGRHDMATRSVHGLDVLREIRGIWVSDRPKTIPFFAPLNTTVCTLPWVQPGHLIAEMGGQASHDQVAELTSRMLVDIAQDLYEKSLRRYEPKSTVLVAHWAISGSKVPSGLPVEQTPQVILDWADLNEIGYDVIIGAHIHEPQLLHNYDLGDKTAGLVVGSPQQLNHGEHGNHGCWIIDLPGEGAEISFAEIESQQFVTVDLDIDEHTLDVGEDLDKIGDVRDAIVRVRYTATEEQARRIDHTLIRRILTEDCGAARVTIEPKIERAARVRAEAITDQLGPVDALIAYCGANDIGPEMQHRMVGRLQEWMATT